MNGSWLRSLKVGSLRETRYGSLDGDSRAEENRLKTVAEEFGHRLQPLFLPGDASPEQWLWKVLRARTDEFTATFGHATADMRKMMDRAAALGEGTVQQHDTAKAALGIFATDIRQTVPEIARSETKNHSIPELLA